MELALIVHESPEELRLSDSVSVLNVIDDNRLVEIIQILDDGSFVRLFNNLREAAVSQIIGDTVVFAKALGIFIDLFIHERPDAERNISSAEFFGELSCQ